MVNIYAVTMAIRTMIIIFCKGTFVREHGNSERILDALVVVKLFPTIISFFFFFF